MDSAQYMQGILESLGWAILHSFWQMALLWLAYQFFFGTRVRVSPLVKHHAAVLALLIGTGWFIATFVQEYGHYVEIGQYLALVPEWQPDVMPVAESEITVSGIIQALTAFTADHIAWLSTIYLCVLALMGWKLLQGYLQIHTLRSKGLVTAAPDLQRQVEQLARRLSIPVSVRVHLSSMIDVPATLGILQPIVLLPVSCITQLSPAQLESILLHELAHIRRMDYLVNLLVGLMETLLLHNPIAWWFARSIRRERELCCDDIVLAQRQDAVEYATALLCLEQQRSLPPMAMAMASNGQQGQLLQRIRRITRRPGTEMSQPYRLMAVGMMILLMMSMTWIGPAHLRAGTLGVSTTTSEISRIILQQPAQDLTRPEGQSRRITEKNRRNINDLRRSGNATFPDAPRADKPEPPAPAPPSPRIYLNEAPPESFTFTYFDRADEDALFIAPALPELQATVPGWVPEMPQRKVVAPGAQLHLQRELESLQKQQENLERIIQAELEREKAMVIYGKTKAGLQSGQERQAAPRISSPRVNLPQNLVRVNIEKVLQGQSLDPQVWQELHRQQALPELHRYDKAPRSITREMVKVSRIKTRDGHTLRIVTEKESIEILIGEDDIIVEKD